MYVLLPRFSGNRMWQAGDSIQILTHFEVETHCALAIECLRPAIDRLSVVVMGWMMALRGL